jgi:hypothetical protein
MERRITKKDLTVKEGRVNELLKNIKLKVSYRYNYIAIDITKEGKILDTLIAGLTKPQAYDILECLERVLTLEKPNLGDLF